jgi:hypothetical protein
MTDPILAQLTPQQLLRISAAAKRLPESRRDRFLRKVLALLAERQNDTEARLQ